AFNLPRGLQFFRRLEPFSTQAGALSPFYMEGRLLSYFPLLPFPLQLAFPPAGSSSKKNKSETTRSATCFPARVRYSFPSCSRFHPLRIASPAARCKAVSGPVPKSASTFRRSSPHTVRSRVMIRSFSLSLGVSCSVSLG